MRTNDSEAEQEKWSVHGYTTGKQSVQRGRYRGRVRIIATARSPFTGRLLQYVSTTLQC